MHSDAMHGRNGWPDAFAIERVLPCARETAFFCAFVTTSAILSSPILSGAPRRGSWSDHPSVCAANRLRHGSVSFLPASCRDSAIVQTICRRTHNRSTHRIRRAILRRRARASNSPRSLSLRTIVTAAGPVIAASENPCRCREEMHEIRGKCLEYGDRTLALLWQITHAATHRTSIFGSAGTAAVAVGRRVRGWRGERLARLVEAVGR